MSLFVLELHASLLVLVALWQSLLSRVTVCMISRVIRNSNLHLLIRHNMPCSFKTHCSNYFLMIPTTVFSLSTGFVHRSFIA